MRLFVPLWVLLTVTVSSQAKPPLIGINLTGNEYYTEEYTFTDLSNHLRTFFAQKNGGAWSESDPGAVTFGADGYPTFIAGDHSARTIWDLPQGHAGGQHVLLWDGTGNISMILTPGSDIVSTAPGRIVFDLPVASNTYSRRGFDVQSSSVSDPIQNLRIVPIAQEAAHIGGQPSNPFRTVFTDRWSNMGAFRYMDWGDTNGSTISDWADRALPGDVTQTDRGIALEHQIKHANVTQTQPWFNIPHLATDDYVQSMATLIRDNLDAGLSARIEYSNEVWNGQFTQSQYAISQAPSLPGQSADFAGGLRWYSKRSVEIFDIFEQVFTNGGANPQGMDRLVRVMASQAANDWVAQQILEYDDAYLKTDALAIAPYFGEVPQAGPAADAWTSATWAQRIAMTEQKLQEAMGWMDNHANLLKNTTDGQNNPIYAGIQLFAYEGGQHFLGAPSTHGDAALTQLMQDLNDRPEMRQFYFDYLTHWDQIGGEDFMLFSSMNEQSIWGSWGHIEYEGQPLSELPKLQGILDYLASVAGDYDLSGIIDSADYDYWKLKFGTNDPQADGNNDGIVDAADYTIWRDGFEAASNRHANALPEPGAWVLIISAVPWLLSHRRKAFLRSPVIAVAIVEGVLWPIHCRGRTP